MRCIRSAWLIILVSPLFFLACKAGEIGTDPQSSSSGGSGSGGLNLSTASSGGSVTLATANGPVNTKVDGPPTPGCGDKILTKDEACDDGNQESNDGCGSNCRYVEAGYSCIPAGEPCHRVARCGDGIAVQPELCDDGNTKAGDGCSPTCKIEVGWKCSGSPSTCTHTTCGDGKIDSGPVSISFITFYMVSMASYGAMIAARRPVKTAMPCHSMAARGNA